MSLSDKLQYHVKLHDKSMLEVFLSADSRRAVVMTLGIPKCVKDCAQYWLTA